MGRPTKCTPEVTDALCALLRNGVGRESTARQVGLSVRTFHTWMEKGRQKKRPYAQFLRRVEAASDELQVEISGVLLQGLRTTHLPTAVHTAEWLGERLFPQTWGKRQELRHSGPDGGPVAHTVQGHVTTSAIPPGELARMSPEQLRALAEGVEAAQGKDEEGQ